MMLARNVALVLAAVLIQPAVVAGQPAHPDAMQILAALEARCRAAKSFAYQGELTVEKRTSIPAKPWPPSKSKVELAISGPDKYLLRIHPETRGEYLLLSDGEKSWTYVPKLRQYSEEEKVSSVIEDEPDETEGESASDQEGDLPESYSIRILRLLSAIYSGAEVAELRGESGVRFEGRKQRLTVLYMRFRKGPGGDYADVQLTLDPVSLKVARLVWNSHTFTRNTKYLSRTRAEFSRFQMGAELSDSTFRFQPPVNAKLVDTVPIPGQTDALLLNRPAPDIQLSTLDGEPVQLSALRGRPILLDFWSSGCLPCRTELPALVRIYQDYKDSGLVVLGIDAEPAATARSFARKMGLSFPTLEDPERKARKMFGVHVLPTVFLVDAQGKVVRFFRGARDESALRTALRDAFRLPAKP
jgi:peroxiredoxin/outer membrane lipoprotein-sorting protein